jgi:putative flippase GtrA
MKGILIACLIGIVVGVIYNFVWGKFFRERFNQWLDKGS